MSKPRTPTPILKLTGQYRADRHGNRTDDLATGKPIKPRGLCPAGRALWDHVARLGRPYLRELDSTELRHLCELWGLYRAAHAAAKADVTDKNARIAVLAYSGEFHRLASKFGLTPVDRARIETGGTDETDDFEEFLKGSQ